MYRLYGNYVISSFIPTYKNCIAFKQVLFDERKQGIFETKIQCWHRNIHGMQIWRIARPDQVQLCKSKASQASKALFSLCVIVDQYIQTCLQVVVCPRATKKVILFLLERKLTTLTVQKSLHIKKGFGFTRFSAPKESPSQSQNESMFVALQK